MLSRPPLQPTPPPLAGWGSDREADSSLPAATLPEERKKKRWVLAREGKAAILDVGRGRLLGRPVAAWCRALRAERDR